MALALFRASYDVRLENRGCRQVGCVCEVTIITHIALFLRPTNLRPSGRQLSPYSRVDSTGLDAPCTPATSPMLCPQERHTSKHHHHHHVRVVKTQRAAASLLSHRRRRRRPCPSATRVQVSGQSEVVRVQPHDPSRPGAFSSRAPVASCC